MGAKFYRGSEKAKKIRKRLTQTRTWFKQFKWIACKFSLPNPGCNSARSLPAVDDSTHLLSLFRQITRTPPW